MDVSKQVESCISAGIKMIALDFDLTLVRIHTSGKWNRSATELAAFVRPIFRSLIPGLINRGMILAIVTFSPQADLIERLLRVAFPCVEINKNTFVCAANCGEN